jgi:hypothetical protein
MKKKVGNHNSTLKEENVFSLAAPSSILRLWISKAAEVQ